MKRNRPFENKTILTDFQDDRSRLRHRQGEGWASTQQTRMPTKQWTDRQLRRFEERQQRKYRKMRQAVHPDSSGGVTKITSPPAGFSQSSGE